MGRILKTDNPNPVVGLRYLTHISQFINTESRPSDIHNLSGMCLCVCVCVCVCVCGGGGACG